MKTKLKKLITKLLFLLPILVSCSPDGPISSDPGFWWPTPRGFTSFLVLLTITILILFSKDIFNYLKVSCFNQHLENKC